MQVPSSLVLSFWASVNNSSPEITNETFPTQFHSTIWDKVNKKREILILWHSISVTHQKLCPCRWSFWRILQICWSSECNSLPRSLWTRKRNEAYHMRFDHFRLFTNSLTSPPSRWEKRDLRHFDTFARRFKGKHFTVDKLRPFFVVLGQWIGQSSNACLS